MTKPITHINVFLVLLGYHVVISAAELSSELVLPPVDATGQNPDPCAYTNYWEAAGRLSQTSHVHNATAVCDLLVQKCRNVCILIYGSGNPDITGIGVCCSHSPPSLTKLKVDCTTIAYVFPAPLRL